MLGGGLLYGDCRYMPDLKAALRKKNKIQVLQYVTTSPPGQETRLSTMSRWRVVIPKVYWTQRSKIIQKNMVHDYHPPPLPKTTCQAGSKQVGVT